MKIQLPKTAQSVQRAIVKTPEGDFTVDSVTFDIDVDLPEGMDPVDVEVYAVGLGSNNQPVGEPVLVKPYERRNTVPVFDIAPVPFYPSPADEPADDEPAGEEDADDDLEPSDDLEMSDDLKLSE